MHVNVYHRLCVCVLFSLSNGAEVFARQQLSNFIGREVLADADANAEAGGARQSFLQTSLYTRSFAKTGSGHTYGNSRTARLALHTGRYIAYPAWWVGVLWKQLVGTVTIHSLPSCNLLLTAASIYTCHRFRL
jgi:hypothetical protein